MSQEQTPSEPLDLDPTISSKLPPLFLPAGDHPSKIARYKIIELLGEGSFGRVYLAHDDELDRAVAIKIPRPGRIVAPGDVESYLREARILAKLEHPNIVPVYDAGRTDDGLCYVVSKYLQGSDLKERIRQGRLPFLESSRLVAVIAEALHYAHTKNLVHRDIKPANILLDETAKPCLADFGLALRDEDFGLGEGLAGTPGYMSPEQARGEGHRVDGRSDVFSLGVVFYELLTARRPFKGESLSQLVDQIKTAEPRPPRQIDDSVPRELERICLKSLAKRPGDRYTTARDMAEDLSDFATSTPPAGLAVPTPAIAHPGPSLPGPQTPPSPASQSDSSDRPVKIVPKGLRAFDEHDAEFFLELLPGARDRLGLPDSIRFWKTRIESLDSENCFRVGLIYGPSGCGKSSLVKAGILPRLSSHVVSVHVEATSDETEKRLLARLKKACPALSERAGLVESLTAVRKGRVLPAGRKLLIVIDQFEQWLHARRGEEDSELVAALRQCDGEHSQAIVLVRDDFGLMVTRFLAQLDVDLVQGWNFAVVDLFDLRHATKVLTAFGSALGNLPETGREISKDQRSFLDQAIAELAQDRKVVSVRLALFAEMMKGKPWTLAALREVGGASGVGVTFLEETFSSPQANPRHRMHQKAAQAILKALLPASGADIKGQMRSEDDLRAVAETSGRTREFQDVLRILDTELRLITPTDPEGAGEEAAVNLRAGRFYQLTHDYLVPSLRSWLTRKQQETRRGRAELKLAERASLWTSKPENRHLPSMAEWANIRLLTTKRDWSDSEHRMMKRAGRVHGLRALAATAAAAVLLIAGLTIRHQVIEANHETEAHGLAQQLLKADTSQLPENLRALSDHRRWADPKLRAALKESPSDSRARLHASLALLPDDPTQAEYIFNRLLAAAPAELPVIWEIFKKHDREAPRRLVKLLRDDTADPEKRFRAACALAGTNLPAAEMGWDQAAPFISDHFLAAVLKDPGDYAPLIETLRPLRAWLAPSLVATFRSQSKPESERTLATTILADYAGDNPTALSDALLSADAKQYATLFPIAQKIAPGVLPVLQAEIEKHAAIDWNDPRPDAAWAQPGTTAKNQLEAARGMLEERFAFCQTMPLEEFISLAEGLRKSGYRPAKVRPYADGAAIRVAAIWTRDGRAWRLASGRSRDEFLKIDETNRGQKFFPVDAAAHAIPGPDGKPIDRFVGVWVESREGGDDSRIEVGLTATELLAAQSRHKADGMMMVALHTAQGADGSNRYCGVWRKAALTEVPAPLVDQVEPSLAASLATNAWSIVNEVSVSPAPPPLSTAERATANLKAAQSDLTAKPNDLNARYAALWTSDTQYETVPVYGLEAAAHDARCRNLVKDGYRPVSISAATAVPGNQPLSTSVWQRPVISDDAKDALAMRQAHAAIALVRLGTPESVWPLLRHSTDPRLRSFIMNWLSPLGADPRAIAAELTRLDSLASRPSPLAAPLFHPETSIRRALILALGIYTPDQLSPDDRGPLIAKLLDLHENDPDSGIHSAAEWTLRKWNEQTQLAEADKRLATLKRDANSRRWFVNTQGQTFMKIEGPVEFRMGSPPSEPGRIARNETPHRRIIPRSFAIAAKEVTIEQYQAFAAENPPHELSLSQFSPDRAGTMNGTSWFDAAAYCNWLSRKEGLDECYEMNSDKKYAAGMRIRADALQRNGYRLPTEAEWEYASRSGAETMRYFGSSVTAPRYNTANSGLMSAYAWYVDSSNNRAWPSGSLLPNDLGLFDTLGNTIEWCQETPAFYQPNGTGSKDDNINITESLSTDRLLRGGAFNYLPSYVRAASRNWNQPAVRNNNYGLRPARTYR